MSAISVGALGPELQSAGRAIGLIDGRDQLVADWFARPLHYLRGTVTDPVQRAGLAEALERLAPARGAPGDGAAERWHPLLPEDPRGNLYLTVRRGPSTDAARAELTLGASGLVHVAVAGLPEVDVAVRMPLLHADDRTLTPLAGSADGPLEAEVAIELGWSRSDGSPIGLDRLEISALVSGSAAGPQGAFRIDLKGLDLGDGPSDVVFDPEHVAGDALELIIGLIREQLERLAADAGDEARRLANHLPALLGLVDGLPRLDVVRLFSDPAALRDWLVALGQGDPPPLRTWLAHVAALLGAGADAQALPPIEGAGSEEDPWRVTLFPLGGGSGIEALVALRSDAADGTALVVVGLQVLVQAEAVPGRPRLEGRVMLARIPLAGTAPATVLPAMDLRLVAPGDGTHLVPAGGAVSVERLRAGLRYDGANLQPQLELQNVVLDLAGVTDGPQSYPRIDLTNADALGGAAAQALESVIDSALGQGVGRHLAALVGLVEPETDPSGAHPVDLAELASHPTRAVASVHRERLGDASGDRAHGWAPMLAEIAALLDPAAATTGPIAVSGQGTVDEPWSVPLPWAAPAGTEAAAAVSLVAWDAADSTGTARLRLGLRARVAQGIADLSWALALVGFDLPAAGEASAQLLGAHHARLRLHPLPPAQPAAGLDLSAQALSVRADWAPGAPLAASATVEQVSARAGDVTVTIPALQVPSPTDLDLGRPDLGIGIDPAKLEALLRSALARGLAAWGGEPGRTLAALLGLHRELPGLPDDWPALAAPTAGDVRTLLEDPLQALRGWLLPVLADPAEDGERLARAALRTVESLLAGRPPQAPGSSLHGSDDLAVRGSGRYDDPWALDLAPTAAATAEAALWLEPDGPPAAWARALEGNLTGADNFAALLEGARRLGSFSEQARGALAAIEVASAADALDALAAHFASTDGVVPVGSQLATGGQWSAADALVRAAHQRLPAAAEAISSITAQLDAWTSPGADRAVLLLGPGFTDQRTAWSQLIGTSPSAHVDLNLPGVDPAGVDLGTFTSAARFFTANLPNEAAADLNDRRRQVERLVRRIAEVKPGVPVFVVAHSTAGLAAAAAAARSGGFSGLITLGTPHGGAPLTPLRDPATADALRMLQRLLPALGAGRLADAVRHLAGALDAYAPGPPGTPPVPVPYPLDAFARPESTSTGTVPAHAIAGTLETDLLIELGDALSALATGASGPAGAAPTHLGLGARFGLSSPAVAEGEVAVEASVRVDAAGITLGSGATAPARAPHRVRVRLSVSRPDGWLVGGSGASPGAVTAPVEARVRWAELGADLEGDRGQLRVTPVVRLHDASLRGVPHELVELADPAKRARLEPLLGAVMRALSIPEPAAGTPLRALLDVLTELGLVVEDPHGGMGVDSAAFAAIVDGAAGTYLGPRLPAALAQAAPLLGLETPVTAEGPWTTSLPELPLDAYLAGPPWRLGLRTHAGGWDLGEGASLSLDASLSLPTLAATAEATLSVGDARLTWSLAARRLTLAAPPFLDELELLPAPDPQALLATLAEQVPRLLLSSLTSALLEPLLSEGARVPPLERLLADPGGWLTGPGVLSGPSGLRADRIVAMLDAIADATGLPGAGGITLPGDLRLTAAATPDGGVALSLATTSPIDLDGSGSLALDVSVAIDAARRISPGGGATLRLDLGGDWAEVAVSVGVDPAGLRLSVTPFGSGPDPAPLGRIELMPRFSGLGPLLTEAGKRVFGAALDAIVDELSDPSRSALLDAVLSLAEAIGIYDPTGGFSAHGDDILALAQPGALAGQVAQRRAAVATELAELYRPGAALGDALPAGLAVSRSSVDDLVTLTWTQAVGATLALSVGWRGPDPALALEVAGLQAGPVKATALRADYRVGAAVDLRATVEVDVPAEELGFDFAPALDVRLAAGRPVVAIFPLGVAEQAALTITVAPRFEVHAAAGALERLAEQWVLKIAANLVLGELRAALSRPLWTGGPTLAAVLRSAGLITEADEVADTFPPLPEIVSGALTGLAAGRQIELNEDGLALMLRSDAGRLGIAMAGPAGKFPIGPVSVGARFAPPELVPGGASGPGATVWLFETAPLAVRPSLEVAGVGLDIGGVGGNPLIGTRAFRLGSVSATAAFSLAFGGNVTASGFGGALQLDELGLPFTQPGQNADNPVAAGLLGAGEPPTEGDRQALNPPVSLAAQKLDGQPFMLRFEGVEPGERLWLQIHRKFGPLYIERIGAGETASRDGLVVGVDGNVSVAGLVVVVEDLSVTVPYASVLNPAGWRLDLRGLALSYQSPGVRIAGALLKDTAADPVQYSGLLSVEVAGRGFTALGAYSRPRDVAGAYTSFFAVVSMPVPLGGPPYLFVTGLGGGVGYNRELLVPSDPVLVPQFALVGAIDPPAGSNPMDLLADLNDELPPKRGALWVAAGVRFTSFGFIQSVAVAYLTLGSGIEAGLLGVSRMQLPGPQAATIVSVELALKARYSSAEAVLSIQAQLTSNSWLLSRDCQLTGGFAFFIWFREGQFVLTLGGYHPSFLPAPAGPRPAYFPDVPRLGFHWRVTNAIAIKGESYFALTTSCVMFGGSLEASYNAGGIRVWFLAALDVLISWDPVRYTARFHVSVGASFTIKVNLLFTTVRVSVSVSLGAEVVIEGPALRGRATVDLAVASVTVAFGAPPAPPPPLLWDAFYAKYLVAGSAEGRAVSGRVERGVLAGEARDGEASTAPGGDAGGAGQPWRVGGEWTLATETRMPAAGWELVGMAAGGGGRPHVDLVPMGLPGVSSTHRVTLERYDRGTGTGTPIAIPPAQRRIEAITAEFPFATWVTQAHPPSASARTFESVSGMRLQGLALVEGRRPPLSAAAGLVDDIPAESRPLPFPKAPAPEAAGPAERRALASAVSPMRGATGARTAPVELGAPRLRGELRARPAASRPSPPPSSVRLVPGAERVERMPPPAPGATLQRVAPPAGAPTTGLARPGAGIRNPELGFSASHEASAALGALAERAVDGGAAIPCGATQVWDVPAGGGRTVELRVSGKGALRLTTLTVGGHLLEDRFLEPNGDGATAGLPARCGMVALTAAGAPAAEEPVGWQLSNRLLQVSPFVLLARGACVRLGAPGAAWRRGEQTVQSRVSAAEAILDQPAVETRLRPGSGTVLVCLDGPPESSPGGREVRVAADGGELGAPLELRAGRTLALLYPVERSEPEAPALVVAVAAANGWRLEGVVGLPGPPAQWAPGLGAGVPAGLVEDRRTAGPPDVEVALATSPEVSVR